METERFTAEGAQHGAAGGEMTALAGLRVVDLSSTLAGATVSGVLADFGADVTMVEPPGGSVLRTQAAWPFWGRGKRSVVLDVGDPEDRAAIQRLAAGADVVVETWRPGVADALGLGWADLSERNPRLVYGSITGFGRDNTLSGIPGYEPVVMAKIGGLTSFGSLVSRPGPAYVATPYGAVSAGHLALHGILAALYEREASGRGQFVETNMAQAVASHDPWNWLIHVIANRYSDGYVPTPFFDEERMIPNSPFAVRLLVALSADGRWMQFSQTTDGLWAAFLRAAGLEWTVTDPRLADGAASDDPEIRREFWELCLAAARSRTYDEWLEVFDSEPDVWAELFRDGSEVLDHPQLVADERTVRMIDPVAGSVHQPGPLVAMDRTPARLDRPAPALDADRPPQQSSSAGARGAAAEEQTREPGDEPPLHDVTIIELGTFFAAPYAATLMAELGARVIKLEPLEGDSIRSVMPFPELGGVKVLAGKESVAVDLTTEQGRDVAVELIRRADVVLCSFRAGAAERLSLTRDDLIAINGDLVVLDAPGYGTGPPCGQRPAFAPTMGAGSGLAARNLGGLDRVPRGPDLTDDEVKRGSHRLSTAAMAVAHADGFSALAVGTALLLGLLSRERQGLGQAMTTSMLSTMAHVLSETTVTYPGAPPVAGPDEQLYGLGPRFRLYETTDGWLFLAAPKQSEWEVLADALDLDAELGDDPSLAEKLAERFASRPGAEWERLLTARGVAAVEVAPQGLEVTMMHTPLGEELGYVRQDTHVLIEEYPRLTPLVRFSRSSTRQGPSPLCGDHTDAVLREIGRGDEEIQQLRASGIIG
jgi:crotonobetainyl-CoA:carnitine CoA-transferase CaiB-like acyl-CoA transferase